MALLTDAGEDAGEHRARARRNAVRLAHAPRLLLEALLGSARRPAEPRSSERPAARRDHWVVGRPLMRTCSPVVSHRYGQPAGESSHVSCRLYTVLSNNP